MSFSLSSSIEATDDRQPKWAAQRAERGFDDTELWNLDFTIISFTLPRLKVFASKLHSYPPDFSSCDKWQEALQKMITSMELYTQDRVFDKNERAIIDEGMQLFFKYFFNLWD